jgi:hypothetical protein
MLFLTAFAGGTMALACRGKPETHVVYLVPSQDASAQLTGELAQDENDIPCAPRRVLQTICQQCHTKPQKNGAPFPLINRSDVVDNVYGGEVVRELMIENVTAGRMPQQPVTISDEDKATLLDWLNAGAPIDHQENCDVGDAGADAETEDAQ